MLYYVHVLLHTQEELEHLQGEEWAKTEASINQLQSEKHELAEELRKTRHSLRVHSDGWRREKSKATALMFSESPQPTCTCTLYIHVATYTVYSSILH